MAVGPSRDSRVFAAIAAPDARVNAVAVALVAALLAFVAGLCLQPVTESDLFFRLKVGQEILAHRHLMDRNTFSFTAPDHPDLDLAWLFEVAVALAFRAGGYRAIVLAKTVVVATSFGLAFAACRRRGASAVAAAVWLAAAAWVMRERLVERPHIISFAGEAVVLVALADARRSWSRARVLGFGALMVLWANGHAGVFVGVLMLGSAAAGFAIARDVRTALQVLRLGALAAGAAFVTPAGPGLLRYLALHVVLPRIHTIDEFRAATWRSDAPFFVGVAVGTAVMVASVLVEGRRCRPAPSPGSSRPLPSPPGLVSLLSLAPELLPVVVVVALGFASVRFSADAALVAAPLLATRATFLAAAWRTRPPRLDGRAAALAVIALLLATALVPRLAELRAGRRFLAIGLDPAVVPWDAIRFVDLNGLRERMYNDFETGSYLALQGYPRARVFIDPRLPAYPEELHRLLGNFDLDRAAWDRAMEEYGVTSALLAYAGVNRRVAWWEPERWALVYRAGDARVFVRRLPRWSDFIRAHEIPATFRFAVETGAETLPLEVPPAASPVPGCEWQRRLGDLLFDLDSGALRRARAHYEQALNAPGCLARADESALAAWLGATALGDRAYERALSLLDRALTLDPGEARTRVNRALVYEALGRTRDAAVDWSRLAADAPSTPLGKLAASRARRVAP